MAQRTRFEDVFRSIVFAPEEERMFATLSSEIASSPNSIKSIGEGFRRDLESVISALAVPFFMASAAVQEMKFRQILTAERIRTLKTPISSEDERDRVAMEIARTRFHEDILNPDTRSGLATDTLLQLQNALKDERFARGAKELLRQGVVLLWGCFEVFTTDLFVVLLNSDSSLVTSLHTHELTRKYFDLRSIPFEVLNEHSFDVSRSLGDLLVQVRKLDNIPLIKAVFDALMPQNDRLRVMLNHKELWMMNQQRHLIVHRRGVADLAYIRNTGESIPVSSELVITPDHLEQYLRVICDTSAQMVSACSELINAHVAQEKRRD